MHKASISAATPEYKAFTYEQYSQARCHQIHGEISNKGSQHFMRLLINQNNGVVCNICPWHKRDENCEAYKLLMSDRPFSDVQPIFTEPVRDEAKRLGISISEVRKRRKGE